MAALLIQYTHQAAGLMLVVPHQLTVRSSGRMDTEIGFLSLFSKIDFIKQFQFFSPQSILEHIK